MKFGPLGWNVNYDFNEGDCETSVTMINNFLAMGAEQIPWDAITYMIGTINYGGRVTDDNDMRLLLGLMTMYVSPAVLNEPNYSFSASGVYHIPADDSMTGFLDYLGTLPTHDPPELFGLSENSNITVQKSESD